MQKMLEKMYKDMECFYRPYFSSSDDMLNFYNEIAAYDNADRIPRQMMNQIYNFVTLANDIDKIRPSRDSLRIMFLKVCLESLAELTIKNKDKKAKFYTDFPNFLSDEGKNYILKNFQLTFFKDTYNGHEFEASHKLTITDFFELIRIVRNMVVHDGNYWEMQFFAHDDDSTWITSIETKKHFLKSYTFFDKSEKIREYHFQTTLNYDKFVYYFVEGCINYVKDYLQKSTMIKCLNRGEYYDRKERKTICE